MKCFGSLKKNFIASLLLSSLVSTTPLSCISMNNQTCKVRLEIVIVNSNDPVFYPFSIKTGKWVAVATISIIHMQKYVFLML